MNKNSAIVIASLVLVVLAGTAAYVIYGGRGGDDTAVIPTPAADAKNATYNIDGQNVTLVNGVSEVAAAPGSASMIVTRYFGNEVVHDFNGDGKPDVAFLLTQTTGGSGTFYYVVAAVNATSGYIGSQGFLLGDRIAPQTTEMGKGNIIVVNYADRNPGESFAVQPSVGKSVWLLLDPKTMQFGQVAQNFEGEADPLRMTLGMKTWNWVDTVYNSGTIITPRIANKFTLTFSGTSTFSAATDCNGVGGEYTVTGSSITFSRMMSTLMYCEGSQEGDYAKMFSEAQSYHFTSKGELIFGLKNDSGSFIFR
jgi:heat shock protein HslJ